MTNGPISDLYDEDRARLLQGYNLAVHHAKKALLISAGIIIITEVIAYGFSGDISDWLELSLSAALFAMFTAMAVWSSKKPYTALKTAAIR